jgi:hypothetical protein
LNFDKNDVLPEGTVVKLKVSPLYQDGDKVHLYYYDVTNKKMKLMSENLEVFEGHVSISLTHTSEYFVTQAVLGNNAGNSQNALSGLDIWIILAGVELLVILLLVFMLSRKSKIQVTK